MMKRGDERGSMYLEFLVAFTVWLVLLSSALPAFLHITASRMEMLIHHEAEYVLAKQMMKAIYREPFQSEVQGAHADYIVTGEEGNGRIRLCVHYKIQNGKEKHVCRTLEKQ